MKTLKFKEIKKAIEAGEIGLLYISAASLYWTHNPKDVKRATAQGLKAQRAQLKKHLNDPGVPQDQKDLIRRLAEESKKSNGKLPLDPGGSPLVVNSNPKQWLKDVLQKPFHYGKYTFEALMKAHGQNCKGQTFQTWGEVQALLDSENIINDKKK